MVAFAVMCSGASVRRRAGDRVRRRLPERVRRAAARSSSALVVIAGRHRDQLPRDQGVGELQRRLHADRARRPVPGRPDRRRVPVRRRRRPRPRALEFNDDAKPALLMIAGASIAFYALIGFEDAVNVAEETKDATRSFPRTLFMGLGIAGAVYLMVTIIAGMAVPADTLADSDGPLLEVVTQGPLSVNSQGLQRDRAVRARQRLPAEPRDGVAADVRHGQRGGRPRAPRHGPRAAAGRRGWRSSSPRASPPCWRSSATSTTLADTTVLLLLLVFVGVHVSLLSCARRPSTTTTSRRRPPLPWLGAATCAGLAVQQVVEDPKLVLWAGGLLLLRLDPVDDRAGRAMIEAWHGTSPPTPSSRSSWTGCATSSRDEVWPIETVFDELGRGRLPARDRAAAGAGEGARPVGRAPAA